MDPFEIVQIKTGDTLDLHTFSPAEVASLLDEYLRTCQEMGIRQIRIIHGKGTGILRRRVRALLEGDSRVASYADAPANAGGWGATVVELRVQKKVDPEISPDVD